MTNYRMERVKRIVNSLDRRYNSIKARPKKPDEEKARQAAELAQQKYYTGSELYHAWQGGRIDIGNEKMYLPSDVGKMAGDNLYQMYERNLTSKEKQHWATAYNRMVYKGYDGSEAASMATFMIVADWVDEGIVEPRSQRFQEEKQRRTDLRKEMDEKYRDAPEGKRDMGHRSMKDEFDISKLPRDAREIYNDVFVDESFTWKSYTKADDEMDEQEVKAIVRNAIRKFKAKGKGKKPPAYMNAPTSDRHPVIGDTEKDIKKIAKRAASKARLKALMKYRMRQKALKGLAKRSSGFNYSADDVERWYTLLPIVTQKQVHDSFYTAIRGEWGNIEDLLDSFYSNLAEMTKTGRVSWSEIQSIPTLRDASDSLIENESNTLFELFETAPVRDTYNNIIEAPKFIANITKRINNTAYEWREAIDKWFAEGQQ